MVKLNSKFHSVLVGLELHPVLVFVCIELCGGTGLVCARFSPFSRFLLFFFVVRWDVLCGFVVFSYLLLGILCIGKVDRFGPAIHWWAWLFLEFSSFDVSIRINFVYCVIMMNIDALIINSLICVCFHPGSVSIALYSVLAFYSGQGALTKTPNQSLW